MGVFQYVGKKQNSPHILDQIVIFRRIFVYIFRKNIKQKIYFFPRWHTLMTTPWSQLAMLNQIIVK